MTATDGMPDDNRYARCIKSSKRVYWDIDEDIIRGRRFDAAHKFLPDGLSLVDTFTTLSPDERRFVSQIQGRTCANIFWAGRAVYQRQGLGAEPQSRTRRPGCARSAGAVQR